jgi:translation initiation factor IF-1
MEENQTKPKPDTTMGVVLEALPNILFRIAPDGGGEEFLAYVSGRMRMNKIRVLVGDRVEVQMDPYGGRGRIVRRH